MSEPVLSVRNLKTHFYLEEGLVRAVDGLSYDLHAGQTLAVVGESGCGKSVHALSLMRLIPEPPGRIVGGEVLYRGQDLLKLPPERMRQIRGHKIAMIFQEPMTSLNPVMRVGDQISESAIIHLGLSPQAAERKAVALLKKVGIPNPKERAQAYPHQFSGGMRQRAMIAMALACDPDILIADEPTTALDVTIQAQILELVKELQRESGMAVILITHNIGVVAQMADEVAVMYAARVVEKAPVDELFRAPKHPYTRGLLQSIPSLAGRKERLTAIPGQPPALIERLRGCPFAPRCSDVMSECKQNDPMDYVLESRRRVNCFLARDVASLAIERGTPFPSTLQASKAAKEPKA
jgi:oligopeptide/dipeptide ABC transporter ATP-binding protein